MLYFFTLTSSDILNVLSLIDDFSTINDIDNVEAKIDMDDGFNYSGVDYEVEGWDVEIADIEVNDNNFIFTLYSNDCFSGCQSKKVGLQK